MSHTKMVFPCRKRDGESYEEQFVWSQIRPRWCPELHQTTQGQSKVRFMFLVTIASITALLLSFSPHCALNSFVSGVHKKIFLPRCGKWRYVWEIKASYLNDTITNLLTDVPCVYISYSYVQ